MGDIGLRVVAETFEEMEKITSRTQLTMLLAKLLRSTPPEIIDKVIYLMQGKLGPDWKDIPELGMGEKFIVKAIALAYKVSEDTVVRMFKEIGDLGVVAERLSERASKSGAQGLLAFMGVSRREITVSRFFDTLQRIAYAQGEGSRDIKIRLLAGILADAEPLEARYIIRFVGGMLRLGVGDATILDSLSVAYAGGAHARPLVERAYNLRADLGLIARLVAEGGLGAVEGVKPQVGIPIRPMLAERGRDAREILEKVKGKAIVEYKYDGERAQIHKKGDSIYIFSRRLENITHMYPDVVEAAKRGIRAGEAIVEGEIVAVDPETGELKPFQELMRRKRKHEVERVMREVPVRVYLFDALLSDGRDLTKMTQPERRRALEDIVEEGESWGIARYIVTGDPDEIERFFLQAVEEGAEGIMIKALHEESVYTAGVRGWLWVKLKRDYMSELMDTVDLVVVGAFYGTGKRGGKLSSLLMAAYDPDSDTFKTVCKVATGFTDEELDKMNEMLKPAIVDRKHPRVDSKVEPHVWVEPVHVAEIVGSELTLSPMHTCGLNSVKPGVGISIRFPRFIRWRPDKRPEDSTTVGEIVDWYKRRLRRVEEA